MPIVAPTGYGKTTFLRWAAELYLRKGKKVLWISPESALLEAHPKAFRVKKSDLIKPDVAKKVLGEEWDLVVVDDADQLISISENTKWTWVALAAIVDNKEFREAVFEAVVEKRKEAQSRVRRILSLVRQGKERLSLRGGVKVIIATATPFGYSRISYSTLGVTGGESAPVVSGAIRHFFIHVDSPLDELEKILAVLGRGGLIVYSHPFSENSDSSKDKARMLARIFRVAEKLGMKGSFLLSNVSYKAIAKEAEADVGKIKERLRRLRSAEEAKTLLKEGKVDFVVISGTSEKFARGFDVPRHLFYTLFVGFPATRKCVESNMDDAELVRERAWMPLCYPHAKEHGLRNILSARVRKWAYDPDYAERLRERDEEKAKRIMENVKALAGEIRKCLREVYGRDRVCTWIPNRRYYYQIAGRAARLLYFDQEEKVGFFGLGISVVLEWIGRLDEFLVREAESVPNAVYGNLDELEEDLKKEVERARRIKGKCFDAECFVKEGAPSFVPSAKLLVVEAPGKVEKIASFFGPTVVQNLGGVRTAESASEYGTFAVAPTVGHLFSANKAQLPKVDGKRITAYGHEIERKRFVFRPVPEDIERVVSLGVYLNLFNTENVLIGTDDDVEGEVIGTEVASILGIDPFRRNVKVRYHEITPKAVSEALKHPTPASPQKVLAGLYREAEDALSGLPWSNIAQASFAIATALNPSLYLSPRSAKTLLELRSDADIVRYFVNNSVGRVQTVVLRWAEERERLIESTTEDSFMIRISSDEDIAPKILILPKRKFGKEITKVELKKVGREKMIPPPPYAMHDALSEASQLFRMSVDKVMDALQRLYMQGLITYPRTSSHHLSRKGLSIILTSLRMLGFSEGSISPRNWPQSGAHEAIRPTMSLHPDDVESMLGRGAEADVYRAVFARALASQVAESEVNVYEVYVNGKPTGTRLYTVPVWAEVYRKVGLRLPSHFVVPSKFSWAKVREGKMSPVRRYTQADLIKKMKEEGIGRPSTYARIVETLFKRGYLFEIPGGGITVTKRGTALLRMIDFLAPRDMFSLRRAKDVVTTIDLISGESTGYTLALETAKKLFTDEVSKIMDEFTDMFGSYGEVVRRNGRLRIEVLDKGRKFPEGYLDPKKAKWLRQVVDKVAKLKVDRQYSLSEEVRKKGERYVFLMEKVGN